MPIDVTWFHHPRVILLHVYDDTGLEEIEKMNTAVRQLMEDSTPPVHFLIMDEKAGPPPVNLRLLRDALNIQGEDFAKFGWVVGVGRPPMIANVIIPMLAKVLRIDYVRRGNLQQAVEFLDKMDSTLSFPAELPQLDVRG